MRYFATKRLFIPKQLMVFAASQNNINILSINISTYKWALIYTNIKMMYVYMIYRAIDNIFLIWPQPSPADSKHSGTTRFCTFLKWQENVIGQGYG